MANHMKAYVSMALIGFGGIFYSSQRLYALDGLTCQQLIRVHPLPYTDGRVGYFCERAFQACLLDKITVISREDLASTPESEEKKFELKHLSLLASSNRAEREKYLAACVLAQNFFENPNNIGKIFKEGL
jgi:hypothetical protein